MKQQPDELPSYETLARALHDAGLFELERRARLKEFSDYDGPHTFPQIELLRELELSGKMHLPGVRKIADRVKAGDFDATGEESESWWEREGKEICPPELRHIFGKPS